MDRAALAALIMQYRLPTTTEWYAVDASVWPRCDAETSPERGFYHHHTRQSHGQPIVAGWNYSWLVQVPERCSSWTAPRQVRCILSGENPNHVAAEQIRGLLHPRDFSPTSVPIVSFDAGYDAVQLGVALAEEQVCLLVRLRSVGSLLLCCPVADANRGTATTTWHEVRVRRSDHLASPHRSLDHV